MSAWTDPLGDPIRPLQQDDIASKFRRVTDGVLDQETQFLFLQGINRLGQGDAQPLLAALSTLGHQ